SIPNASLASQATGPPLNSVEMSFAGRTFPELGRKMLGLVPLATQLTSTADSVLGGLSRVNNPGLNTSYTTMIQNAFQNNLWNSAKQVTLNTAQGPLAFSQIEANFSLFWGLSIMFYESTLVSDRAPFDRFQMGNQNVLSLDAQKGFNVFVSKCQVCHSGSEF